MYIVIVNPIAGNGKARKIYEEIRYSSYLKDRTIFYMTEYKGHIKEIIKEIELNKKNGLQIELLFIIGGDGTVNEVINALTDIEIKISYIPGGSGNDFSRGIRNYNNPNKIIEQAITNEKNLSYWLGSFRTNDKHTKKFVNCIGFGFDAVVAKSASKLSFRNILSFFHLDSLIYLIALLRELVTYKPLEITVHIDGKQKTYSDVLFLTVSNQPYMGGGMKINPQAHNNANTFSLLIVDSIPKWKVFLLFGTVFIGKHVLFKEVHTFKTSEIAIYASHKIPCQVDGEYREVQHANIQKYKKRIIIKGVK